MIEIGKKKGVGPLNWVLIFAIFLFPLQIYNLFLTYI